MPKSAGARSALDYLAGRVARGGQQSQDERLPGPPSTQAAVYTSDGRYAFQRDGNNIYQQGRRVMDDGWVFKDGRATYWIEDGNWYVRGGTRAYYEVDMS
jgi:hypothetical protein